MNWSYTTSLTGVSPSIPERSRTFQLCSRIIISHQNTTSLLCYHNRFSLGCFLFVRHYLGNLNWFLFLVVLRCFNSNGSTSATNVTECVNTRFSFGNLGIVGHMRLPRAYRSLSRPSSLLKPSNPSTGVFTPAYTVTYYTTMHDDHCVSSAVDPLHPSYITFMMHCIEWWHEDLCIPHFFF